MNEPSIGSYLGVILSDLGANAATLDLDNFTLNRLHRNDRSNVFNDDFRDVWLPGLARLLRARFYAHAAALRPAGVPLSRVLVALKEPNGSQSADVIMAALPGARFLYLLRDGRDVVDSELAACLEGGWVTREFPGVPPVSPSERVTFLTNSAHKWLWRTEIARQAFDKHTGPKHLLRYEDLLREPHENLRSVFAWLDLDVSEDEVSEWIRMNDFDQIPSNERGPKQFYRAASPGLWRVNLTEEEKSAVDMVIGGKLRELGYSD